MRNILCLICAIFIAGFARADTIDINWHVGDSIYDTSTCTVGGDVILPTTPTKYGYTFAGWEPSDYIFLDYIELTGTQWIDTGVIFYNNADYLRFSLKAQTTTVNSEREILSNDTSAAQGFNVAVTSSSRFFCFDGPWRSTAVSQIIGSPNNAGFIEVSGWFSNGGFFCDVAETPKTGTYTAYNNQTILIGSRRGYGQTHSFIGKIYYVKISLDNVLVRDFVPAKRLSDNTVGMYDLVSETFFGNAGTGTFVAGPVAE